MTLTSFFFSVRNFLLHACNVHVGVFVSAQHFFFYKQIRSHTEIMDIFLVNKKNNNINNVIIFNLKVVNT